MIWPKFIKTSIALFVFSLELVYQFISIFTLFSRQRKGKLVFYNMLINSNYKIKLDFLFNKFTATLKLTWYILIQVYRHVFCTFYLCMKSYTYENTLFFFFFNIISWFNTFLHQMWQEVICIFLPVV